MLVTATFLGSNPLPDVIAEGLAESQCNYFLGDDPLMWRTDVPSYSAVTLRNVYDGIDLHFFAGADGRLAYKYSTSADANTSQVKMAYKGLEMVSADADGRLIGKTKWGDICGLLTAPVTMTDGASARIEPRFDGEAPERITHTVLPQSSPEAVSLVFSTYLGGANLDVGYDIAVDGSGCAYVIGFTMSADFPTQTAYDPVFDGGDYDVFVTKLSQAGDGLAFSTFLGGSLDESGTGIAVDASGCVYVTGNTYSSDFPTQNAYDASFNGGDFDGFVTKLSSAGNSLIYSTFFGGSDQDNGWDIAVDGSVCAYVSGTTASSNFPTQNAFDASYNGGRDAFVIRFAAEGSSLVYSTFLGGTGYDEGFRIAVDAYQCAYVTGATACVDFPTQNAAFPSYAGGEDGFATKLSPVGNSLLYSTFLGGTGQDQGRGIAVDLAGCAYITGETSSDDFPTVNAYDATHAGSYGDVFVSKVNATGTSLVYSTYLGSTGEDRGYNIAIDNSMCAYVTGRTYSTLFPTKNAFDATYDGTGDVFVTKVSQLGDALIYSTFLGNELDDQGCAIAVDSLGCTYVTGFTYCSDFPILNAVDGTFNGGWTPS